MSSLFVDVLVPIPIENTFVYSVTESEYAILRTGMRVVVPFGKSKIYTGLALRIHQTAPRLYKAKPIYEVLDENPVVTTIQIKFWQWIAKYYMCTLGEVYKAAVPSALILETHTLISPKNDTDYKALLPTLSTDELLLLDIIENREGVPITEILNVIGQKKAIAVVNSLIEKQAITVYEQLVEKYKPKYVSYVRLNPKYTSDEHLQNLLLELKNAPKRRAALMKLVSISLKSIKPIKKSSLIKEFGIHTDVIKALIDKDVIDVYHLQVDRVNFDENENLSLKTLSIEQQNALDALSTSTENVVLLKGVTSSGKTEVYARYIQSLLDSGKQVLYMLPEIGLATQQLARLSSYFGKSCSVYHSKYSNSERVEVWYNVLNNNPKAHLVIGTRSALFLPFSNLGAIVIDEEHEATLKQTDPAPRYHSRDTAIVLATYHNAKVILGSATPSFESYNNASTGKYKLVTLNARYKNILPPNIELIDLKLAYKKREMKGVFSKTLLDQIENTVAGGEQVILFHNRRGFAPLSECLTCGFTPKCTNCDVSLTYHKYSNQLRCHYCGYSIPMQNTCAACGTGNIDVKGFGTEQVELQLKEYLPQLKTMRMDLETTRGKYDYEKILEAFSENKVDVLIGTQMVTKGLDFKNVALVGIICADKILNFPDFRAYERAFQLMHQVAGRSGRSEKQGHVMVQTYNVEHPIFKFLKTADYEGMYQNEVSQREHFKYPPFYRLLKITLKHKGYNALEDSSLWLTDALKRINVGIILGPEAPAVSKIKNEYLKVILLKFYPNISLDHAKTELRRVQSAFASIPNFRSVRVIFDVDNL